MNGITVDKSTIANQLPGSTGTPFPGDRLVYNVYADGSNSANIATANPATMNAVSEDGFLCKPSAKSDVDPNTGSTYLSEIDKVITGAGLLPNAAVGRGRRGGHDEPAVQHHSERYPEPGMEQRPERLGLQRGQRGSELDVELPAGPTRTPTTRRSRAATRACTTTAPPRR